MKNKKNKNKKKLPKLSTLKKKAWKLFSEIIRRRDSVNGKNTCVTCGKVARWQDLQAGHFLRGRHNAVLFNFDGVWPQCLPCNVWKHGNEVAYTLFMQKKFGNETVECMIQESHSNIKFTRDDYHQMIRTFTDMLERINAQEEIKIYGVRS